MDKLKRLRTFCEADPSNPFAWYTLAMEQRKTDLPAALAIFAQIRTDHPAYLASYYHYAKALEDSGDYDKAAATYREGMEVAKTAGDVKTYDELEAALDLLR